MVCILSLVAMLSFSSTGTPCIGPRTLPAFRSASSASAWARASGLVSSTERSCPSTLAMRSRYFWVIERAVSAPLAIES